MVSCYLNNWLRFYAGSRQNWDDDRGGISLFLGIGPRYDLQQRSRAIFWDFLIRIDIVPPKVVRTQDHTIAWRWTGRKYARHISESFYIRWWVELPRNCYSRREVKVEQVKAAIERAAKYV